MKQVLFIHSAGPQGEQEGSTGLLRYLKDELGSTFQVIAPKMPDPEDPQYARWKQKLKEEIASLEDGSVLVGHSIGGSALFKFLSEEELGKSFAKLITIAAPLWGINADWEIENFTLAEDFISRSSLLPNVVLFHSIGDDIVPFNHMEKYMENIPKATVRQLPGSDHVFQDGLEELVEEIRKV
ncbi:putative alpha/beta hydrolase family esterase [Planomicrobium stackebrandtii]|uniref:Alpha/beta hydrolase family esterase n=1 Tax=Planomicrobium stackebrandtii TaxID=253160 RepID=A0ABU0GTL7_9BACL|nr:alpha/beta hydrolase [Planomicrobium stackebrandtii]MDQ0428700.1 putative alpha/beta hydrolase family esterase [Planomicrobium stackebrandtii]